MLEEQKKSIRKIQSSCNTNKKALLDRWSEEMKHNNESLNTLSKEIKLKRA